MKVLMFGWEFPPKIYGGLAVASYGITKGLSLQGDVETTFCMPKPTGEEEDFLKIVGMNQVPIVWRDVDYNYLKSRLTRNMTPEDYYSFRDHIYSDFSYMHVNDIGCMDFAGGYPGNLHEEINNFSVIAGVVARQQEFDIIHAHDWLTYPAGVHAKMVSGKPLCIHVHATDFDRSRGKVNPTVYSMEKNGMDYADCIMCVSELTRRTVIEQYHQNPKKVFAMHNAVYPLSQEYQDIPRPDHSKEKIVTFLGRITLFVSTSLLALVVVTLDNTVALAGTTIEIVPLLSTGTVCISELLPYFTYTFFIYAGISIGSSNSDVLASTSIRSIKASSLQFSSRNTEIVAVD